MLDPDGQWRVSGYFTSSEMPAWTSLTWREGRTLFGEQAAALLVESFNNPRGWPTSTMAREEVSRVIGEGFARAAIDGATLLGWVGGLPSTRARLGAAPHRGAAKDLAARHWTRAGRGLRVRGGPSRRAHGHPRHGRRLGYTSLAGVDLYADVPRYVPSLHDLGHDHPFLFFRKVGFVVTGVMPDANGRGRPDIYMSKPVHRPQ
jgi:aminoglycoside 6'-N-acetyltransferase I